jgi:hypothetical protein
LSLVQEREHLLVSPDHGLNEGTTERVEFRVIHPDPSLHVAESRVPLVLRQQREVVAELADREGLFQLFLRTIGVINQRLSVGHKRFGKGAHVQILSYRYAESLVNCGELEARLQHGGAPSRGHWPHKAILPRRRHEVNWSRVQERLPHPAGG